MSINNPISSHILTCGSTKDTQHIIYLESQQKELEEKVARLERQAGSYCPQRKCLLTIQQLLEKDTQLREKDKESCDREKYIRYIEEELDEKIQLEETSRLERQSKTAQTLEAEKELAKKIIVVQQLRTELKSRSKQVQQLGVKLAEKNEIVAKLQASLKEVSNRDFRPAAHNTWREEYQRTADGETDIYSNLSDIGGTDTGSKASAEKVRNVAKELEDADHVDGEDSSHDLEGICHTSEANETQRASVPVDPDDPENRKASIEKDEEGEAKQCAPHPIKQGGDAHTKTNINTLELAKSDKTNRDSDSGPASCDAMELSQRVDARLDESSTLR